MSVIVTGPDSRTLPTRDTFGYPIAYYRATLLTDGAGNVECHPNGDAMVVSHTGDVFCGGCAAQFSGQAFTVALAINEALPAGLACDGCWQPIGDVDDDADAFYTAPPTRAVAAVLEDARADNAGLWESAQFTTGADYNVWGESFPRRDDDGNVAVHVVVLTWHDAPAMVAADESGAAAFLCAECAHDYLTGPNGEWAACIIGYHPASYAAGWQCDGCGDRIGG